MADEGEALKEVAVSEGKGTFILALSLRITDAGLTTKVSETKSLKQKFPNRMK